MATVLQADKRFIGRRQELAALDAALDTLKAPRAALGRRVRRARHRQDAPAQRARRARRRPAAPGLRRPRRRARVRPAVRDLDRRARRPRRVARRAPARGADRRARGRAGARAPVGRPGAAPAACRTSASTPTARCARCCSGWRWASRSCSILDDVHWADDASLELIAHLLRRPPPRRDADRARVPRRSGSEQPARGAGGRRPRRAGHEHRARPAHAGGGRRAARRPRAAVPVPPERRQPVLPGGARARGRARRRAGRGGRTRSACRPPSPPPSGRRSRALAERRPAAGLGRRRGRRAVRPRPRGRRRRPRRGRTRWPRSTTCSAARVAGPTDVPRRYRFRHPLVRRAVYDGAGEAWRLQAHARAAAALAARPGALAARAHHVEQSARVGDDDAAAVLEQAGHQAAARAPAIAARWFEAALRLLGSQGGDDPFRRLGLLVPLAGALAATGRLERALDTLVDALALVEMADLRVRLIAACAACENLLGRHDAAHARLLAALDALEDQHGAAAAALHAELAADALYDSDFEAMRSSAARAVETARRAGGPRPGGARHRAAVLRRVQPRPRRGGRGGARGERGAARRAARRPARAAPRRAVLPRLRRVLLRALRRRDPPPAARHQPLARGRPGPVRRADAGRPRPRAGDPRAARRGGRDRRRRARGRAPGRQPPADRLGAGRRRVDGRGRRATSTTRAPPATRRSRCSTGLDDSVLTRATHAHLGVMWIDIGEIDRGLDSFRAVGMPDFPSIEPARRGWIYAVLARAELARGDQRRRRGVGGAQRGDPARASACRSPRPGCCTRAPRSRMAAGDPAAAAELALDAAERAESVDAPLPAARCRTLAGEALAAAGRRDDGVRELQRAETELSALGAARYRDEAARELRRLGERVAARQRRGGGEGLDVALRPRARDRRAGRRGPHEPRDRRRAVPLREDRRRPPHPGLRQARRDLPRRGRRGRRPRPRLASEIPANHALPPVRGSDPLTRPRR